MAFKSPWGGVQAFRRRADNTIGASSGAVPYSDKVVGYAPILYYQMNETAGVNITNYGTLGAAADGTHSAGVTVGDALGPDGVGLAPFYDGANDYTNAASVALVAAWNNNTMSWMVWFKVANAGVWTDGSLRANMQFGVAADQAQIYKSNANNRFYWSWNGTVATKAVANNAASSTDWVCVASTWDATSNEYKAFWNGVQEGATQNGAGAMTGISNPRIAYGSLTNNAANWPWHGWLAHCAIWDRVLTPAEIADLATV